MCQLCVDDGLMTADQLASRRRAGDQSVMPLVSLEPEVFLRTIVQLTVGAMVEGMDPEDAVNAAMQVVWEYFRSRGMSESDLAKMMNEIG